MRDCNKCVYSTRDGNCRKWECKGTVTVEDIRKEAIKDFAEWLKDNSYLNWVGEGNDVNSMSAEEALAEYEKEQKK